MGQHLVIDEVVGFGGLHHTVQRQDAPKGAVLEHTQPLVFGLAVIQQLVDLQRLGVIGMQGFGGPVAHAATSSATIPSPRSSSLTRTLSVPKAAFSTSTAFQGRASPHMKTSKAP